MIKFPNHYVEGIENFIADEKMASFKNIGLRKKELSPLPHLVISFGDEDAGNYLTAPFVTCLQLQIPLKVTVLVGENYSHDVSELRMMALGRRNTFIQVHPYNLPGSLCICGYRSSAHQAICHMKWRSWESSCLSSRPK